MPLGEHPPAVRPRRLTIGDILVFVVLSALILAGLKSAWRSERIDGAERAIALALAVASFVLAVSLRWLARAEVNESTRWSEFVLLGIYLLFCIGVIGSVVIVGLLDHTAGGLLGLAHAGLLFYLVTWD